MGKASKPDSDTLKALIAWKDGAADPALRNVDQFALKVGLTLQEIVKRLEKLEAKLAALAGVQGLAWQSGWLPANGKNGDNKPAQTVMPGFDMREHVAKVPEGAVPSLKGGWTYPTYL